MENKQVFISVCSQKGGVGKSTFTVLLASWLHYVLGHEVLVVDCDVPQSSIYALRERELEVLERSDYHKLMMIRQFKQTGRKIWPVIESTPGKGLADAERFIAQSERPVEIVLFDMPGTVGTSGVINVLARLDYLFVPMKADKVVMESALSFARTVNDLLVRNSKYNLRGVYLFWTMIDRRERTPLYAHYEHVLETFGLSKLQTCIPYRSRFNKELLGAEGGICRSTLLPADRAFAQDAQIAALADEMLSIIKTQR